MYGGFAKVSQADQSPFHSISFVASRRPAEHEMISRSALAAYSIFTQTIFIDKININLLKTDDIYCKNRMSGLGMKSL
jgi:hypothetical protein